MRSRSHLLIVVACVVAGFAILLATVSHFAKPTPMEEGQATSSTGSLFAATFTDAQGTPQAVEQWRNQVIVLNFWASWCPPCRDEMPELSALQKKYRARGVVVLGISTDDAAKMQQFAQELPVSYPLLAGDSQGMDLAATLGNNRDVLPYTLILRRDGSIAASYFGRINFEVLEQTLTPLM